MNSNSMNPHQNPEGFLGLLAAIGTVVGLGKLLASEDKLTKRIVIGRAIVSGGLGAAAGASALLFPEASPLVHYGLAATCASLGTSGIELLLARKMSAK